MNDGGSSGPTAAVAPARRPPSTVRKVVVSILAVVAILAQLALGLYYLLLMAVSADDPAQEGPLTLIKALFGAVYVAMWVGLLWAWSRFSWLVIAAPIVAAVVFFVGYGIASSIVPNHLNFGP